MELEKEKRKSLIGVLGALLKKLDKTYLVIAQVLIQKLVEDTIIVLWFGFHSSDVT